MNDSASLNVPGAFRDRRGPLLVAGILEIVMGACAVMMAGMMVLAVAMQEAQGVSTAGVAPGVVMYVMVGALFIALGIGSIRAKRWVRALWLVISGGWLVCGVLATISMAVFLPALYRNPPDFQNAPPPGAMAVILTMAILVLTVIMVVLPLAIFLFYRSPHVKATCEAAHPEPSWTDRCPLPALAASLWLGLIGLMSLVMPFTYRGLFPLFGSMPGGLTGIALWLLVSAVFFAAAHGIYNLRPWAWWVAFGIAILMSASSVVTFTLRDPMEFYRAMGMQETQLEQIQKMGFAESKWMIGSTAMGYIPLLVILAWARVSVSRMRGSVGVTAAGSRA